MPGPQAICIEDLHATDESSRYLRCVALAGRQPGLRLDQHGQVLWKGDEQRACELWVSADERLILYRPAGSVPVTVCRAGRSLQAPEARPVVLLDGDTLELGGRNLRVHIHGEAPGIHPPSPLELQIPTPPPAAGALGGIARTAAAAMALGVLAGTPGCKTKNAPDPKIEVRERPPSVEPAPPPPRPDMGVDITINKPDKAAAKPIEVRVKPPEPPAAPPPAPPKKK